MSISTKAVCDKITSLIASKTLNAAEAAALSVSYNLDVQTSTWTGLPAAASNEGRFYYVTDCCGYHYSDGTTWNNSVDSTPFFATIFETGSNITGQLGDGTTVNKSSPVSIIGGFNDWRQISASDTHSSGIRESGIIWSWGSNSKGQLGDGTTTDKSSPVSIVGGFTWGSISSGERHKIGLRNDNFLWSWGDNTYGQLGDGTTIDKSSPVSTLGGFAWCEIATTRNFNVGITTNGASWSWGYNKYGQLGDGTTIDKSSPVSIVGGFTDWCDIKAGVFHSLGIRTNGTAWTWGSNTRGELGDNTTTSKSSPVSVVGGFADWCSVGAGNSLSLGLRTNGTAWAWGTNTRGTLGDGTTIHKSSPVSVVGGFTDWCGLSVNGASSSGIRTNGTAWAWGCNNVGQLGDGTTVNSSSPIIIVNGFTSWSKISSGSTTMMLLKRGS